MNAYEQLVDRLRERGSRIVAHGERRASAQCPAHEDREPSLSVGAGHSGDVVLHCHAGCDVEDVLTALGLAKADLFDTPREKPDEDSWMPCGHRKITEYRYLDEDGRLLFAVARCDRKDFRQWRPDSTAKNGRRWNISGVRRVPYRLPAVLAAGREARRVFIVEGEKDVHAVEAAGEAATCNPGGAGKWRTEYAAYLESVAEAVVVADRDEPGRKHAREVAASLSDVGISVTVVEPKTGKDVSDHLNAGHALDELVPMKVDALDELAPMKVDKPAESGGDGEFSDAHLAQQAVNEALAGSYLWALGLGWLRWDGTRWKSTPEPAVRERLRQWAISNYEDADRHVTKALKRDDRKAIRNLAEVRDAWLSVCSRARLNAVADLARGIVLEDTSVFDAHPDLLNCPNGVVDLRTGKIQPHDPALRLTKLAGCDYDPAAAHPDWVKTLSALPTEVADWLQTRVGQAATGYPPDDDVVTVHQGAGKNGKTTMFAGVRGALGELHQLIADRVIFANPGDHPTELMSLRGVRFALIEETPEERRLDIQRLKRITGTTEITARLIAKDTVTFSVTHSLFITSNHRPTITQTDYGTWRRLALIRYPRTFTGKNMDATLRDRVKRDPAVHRAALAWIVTGARRWYDAGMVTPPAPKQVETDTDDWRTGSDLVLGYWRDRLIPELNTHVLATELYQDFSEWLRRNGQQEWAARTFVERFDEHQETERHKVVRRVLRRNDDLRRRDDAYGVSTAPEQYTAVVGFRFRQACDLREDAPVKPVKPLLGLIRSPGGFENDLGMASQASQASQAEHKEDVSGAVPDTRSGACSVCGEPLGETYARMGRDRHPGCRPRDTDTNEGSP